MSRHGDSFDPSGVSIWVVAGGGGGAIGSVTCDGNEVCASCFTLSLFFILYIFLCNLLLLFHCAVLNIVRALGTKVRSA